MSGETPKCVICMTSDDQPIAKLGAKGCEGLTKASLNKGDKLFVVPGNVVHLECRRTYCHPNQKRQTRTETELPQSPRTRHKSEKKFDFEKNCLFCGSYAKIGAGNKRGFDTYPVRTFDFQNTIRDVCTKRQDDWGNTVLGRIEYAQDLPAVEARYHQLCSSNFRSGYNIPKQYQAPEFVNSKAKKGRPTKPCAESAFFKIIEDFENNVNDQTTISDLVDKMRELCGDNAYSTVYMKKRVIEHFGGRVTVTEFNGKHNVITFQSNADAILHAFYRRNGTNDSESEKRMIIKTAAKLIFNDIKSDKYQKEIYPSSSEVMSSDFNMKFLPNSLQLLLIELVSSKKSEKRYVL
ncbi:uncharacterized protein LOC132736408 [Ruditapes philippinarum]|uniref:uncharacterized protein LOC132736408 n=1 Tax=Ruditapes philippinarum TaxID=129788 RepID=UPI00295B8836|nr:uncharacterized protein LOC132736408 [Ruditapes philippinarum]XP_060579517.1 uncharacterized protein LOC132736408 [Ruditapes philippinarum]